MKSCSHWVFPLSLMQAGVLLLATLLWLQPAVALPAKGTPAPALTNVHLLQAPKGSQAAWDRLRGKVVVLEFWATWCAPCIASLPHFNQLAKGLDPARFSSSPSTTKIRRWCRHFSPERRLRAGLV